MGAPINGPAQGVAMVFQSFALFPWLTVLENVQLGLEALELAAGGNPHPRPGGHRPLIGLDGYESAYPRANYPAACASASASHGPWWCIPQQSALMDEPFQRPGCADGGESSHRPDRALQGNGKLPIKGIILVTAQYQRKQC